MKKLVFQGGVVTHLDKHDELEYPDCTRYARGNDGSEYIIKDTIFDNIDEISVLKNKGYSFFDRVLRMKIDLASTEEQRRLKLRILPGVEFGFSNLLPDDIVDIANNAFIKDRRFHPKEHYDKNMAYEIINSYIREYMNIGGVLYTASYNGRIVGFIIMIDEDSDEAHNVLGAVIPEITGRAIAYPMYCTLLKELQKQGYKRYLGIVSSSNITSINLHIQLGAYVMEVTDEYILRRE